MDKENKSSLPSIKKFTSYSNNKLSDLDELLLENEDILNSQKIQSNIQEDSFDFENSDELNSIISKYENLLKEKPKITESLEEREQVKNELDRDIEDDIFEDLDAIE
jgi:hypothetical protein